MTAWMLRPARQAGLYAVFGHAAPKCPVIPQTRLISQSAAVLGRM